MINFERTEPLTTAELIKLHQIRYFLRLNSGTSLPQELEDVIPKDLVNIASLNYTVYDKQTSSYEVIQQEISRKLLRLRVDFQEHVNVSEKLPGYQCNFKMMGEFETNLIMLKGETNSNRVNGEWNGHHGLKAHFLSQIKTRKLINAMGEAQRKYTMHIIDTEEWNKKSESAKLEMLFEMSHGAKKEHKMKKAWADILA